MTLIPLFFFRNQFLFIEDSYSETIWLLKTKLPPGLGSCPVLLSCWQELVLSWVQGSDRQSLCKAGPEQIVVMRSSRSPEDQGAETTWIPLVRFLDLHVCVPSLFTLLSHSWRHSTHFHLIRLLSHILTEFCLNPQASRQAGEVHLPVHSFIQELVIVYLLWTRSYSRYDMAVNKMAKIFTLIELTFCRGRHNK